MWFMKEKMVENYQKIYQKNIRGVEKLSILPASENILLDVEFMLYCKTKAVV